MGHRASATSFGTHLNSSANNLAQTALSQWSGLRNLLILAPIAVFPFLIVGGLWLFKSSSLKRSIADTAIYAAQGSPETGARLGLPIQPGWPIRGRVVTRHGSGDADLQIPLSGSRNKGLLLERAQERNGKWRLCSLRVQSGMGPDLILVDGAKTNCLAR